MTTRFAPHRSPDQSSFIVMRDFGRLGLESVTSPDDTRDSIIESIAQRQIDRVVSVVEYNVVEGWSKDITADIRDAVEQIVVERALAA